MLKSSVVFRAVFSAFRSLFSGFRVLCAMMYVLSSGLVFVDPGEAGSFGATLGEDGMVTFSGSEGFECSLEEIYDFASMAIVNRKMGIQLGVVYSGSPTVSVGGIPQYNLACGAPASYPFTVGYTGGEWFENIYGEKVCRPISTAYEAEVTLPEGREIAIISNDRVKGIETIGIEYDFPYSSALEGGGRFVTVSIGNRPVYSESDLPESGSIPVSYDFTNWKRFVLISATAGCGGYGRTTEALVYTEPEDSCSLDVGKPVNAASGNVYLSETDFNLKGVMPEVFTRYYDSSETTAGGFGPGWGHTYSTKVSVFPGSRGNTYEVINPDGHTVYYIDNEGDGVYHVEFPKGEKSRLIKKTDGAFVREFFDGRTEEFNSLGLLTAVADRNGNRTTLTRGDNNRLTGITDPSGRVISVINDAYSRITSMTLPDGKVIGYSYEAAGLDQVSYPDGSMREYEYIYAPGAGYRLSGVKDENGHYIERHTYYTSGGKTGKAKTSSVDGVNELLTITYDSDTQSTVTDSLGRSTTYTLDKSLGKSHATNISGPGCKSCGQGDGSYIYSPGLDVTSRTEANGNTTVMTYDADGNMLSRTEAYGTVDERTTTYTYNGFGQILTETLDGITTGYNYDDYGNMLTKTEALGSDDERTTSYTYNASGQRLTVTGPDGDTAANTYDRYGNLETVTNALSRTITYGYDLIGNPVSMTDVNGNTTTYEYDLRDRLIRETKPDGGVTVYEYDPAGNRTAVIDANGNRTEYVYDGINRLIEIRSGEWPSAPANAELTTYTYDTEGNMTSMIIMDGAGNVKTSETYAYDDHNRPVRTAYPDGSYTETAYDNAGNVLSKRNENGNVTRYAYDALNRLVSVTDPGGGVASYSYDGRNNLTRITDAKGNVTAYVYDGLNRPVSITGPDTGTTSYTYDADGNMLSKTGANNTTTTYAYDALNRLTATQFPEPAQDIEYYYDDPLAGNGNGRLTAMTDPSGATWYDYDKMGRVARESRLISDVTYITEYSYDLNGNVLAMTYPSGRMIGYSYNRLNKVASVADNYIGETRTLAEGIAYQLSGDMRSMTYGNGIISTRRYDGRGRPTGLLIQGPELRTLNSLSYSRDDAGNMTALTDNLSPSKNKSYSYDNLQRLTFAAGPWGATTYAYDPAGNRTNETTGSGNTTYDYIANKLTSSSGEKASLFNYDDNGNTISELQTPDSELRTYVYNHNQRLTKAMEGSTVLGEYAYNGNGQRVRKCADNGTRCTVFHYDRQGLLIAESSISGDIIAEYIYLNGQLLARTGSGTAGDADGDGAADVSDNCRYTANPDQRDTNADEDDDLSLSGIQHYGNICDPDVDNDGLVGIEDYDVWRGYFRQTAPPAPEDADFNGNGLIGLDDYNIWRKYYTKAPGPGRDSSVEGNRIYYYHNDHLGSPVLMMDSAGAVVWQGEFKPFGEPVSVTGSITNNLRFPGQYYDSETGLHQNWHRDYVPETGRYMEADPILQPMVLKVIKSGCAKSAVTWRVPMLTSDPQGMLPYAYTKGNPINLMDPAGLVCGSGWNDWFVPDKFPSYNFTGCCQSHDDCYGCKGKAQGLSKAACDQNFCSCLLEECELLDGDSRRSCEGNAKTYCNAVQTKFGNDAFNNARRCCNRRASGRW
ncbi:MAG: RHS domain-containing protein [Nitrospirae bacterium]|nr:RHS domain-containing protein [Nitrospirota bacterium]